MSSSCSETFLLFEPHPLVNTALQALIAVENKTVRNLSRLRDIALMLNDNERQTVIMELYHNIEGIYDVVRFLLSAGRIWPRASWVVFTDITHSGIMSLLAEQEHLSLVAKRDDMDCLQAAIAAPPGASRYHSPAMQPLLLQGPRSLSGCEWRILGLMVAGASAQHTAQVIGRNYKTVCTHKLNIMRKLGLNQVGFMLLLLAFRTRY